VRGAPSWPEAGQPRPPTIPEPFRLSTAETAPLVAGRPPPRARAGGGRDEPPPALPPPPPVPTRRQLERVMDASGGALDTTAPGINVTHLLSAVRAGRA